MKPRPCIKRSLYAFICLIYFNFLCFAVKKKKNSDWTNCLQYMPAPANDCKRRVKDSK